MELVYGKCCGVDIHKKLIVACFRQGRKQEIREFGASTRELLEMTEWLTEGGCEKVAMESTASYWKPLYNILETAGLSAMVVNAQHMKAVPGRKTDASDAEWIADLLQHGLLRASFIPDKARRELRELVGYRKSLIKEQAAELNRVQKILEGANIKLSGTVREINGKSGRSFLDALLAGEKIDLAKITEMRRDKSIASHLKATDEQLVDDLNGVLSTTRKKTLQTMPAHNDELSRHIKELDDEIDRNMKDEEKIAAASIQEIPGIGNTSAEVVISVIGTDMSRFPTDGHISSWAGLCPGNNQSAGKRKSGKTRKGNSLLRSTLVVCAHSAVKNKNSYFYAQFQRISAHRGKKRAHVAIAHSILIAIYHVLKDNVPFRDLGSEYYNQFNRERKINAYLKKLKALGWNTPAAEATLST